VGSRPGGAGLVHAQLRELGADAIARYGSLSDKHRYFVGNHLVFRVDSDSITAGWNDPLEPSIEWADALVIADYGKGAMTRALAHQIVETGLPCFVDAKHHWNWYAGSNVTIFPNEHECLDETFMADQVVRKLGKNGCEHFNIHLPASVSEVVDVTGAGDIFMAGFVFAWSLDFRPESCLRFANALAGESCRHVGTYVVPRAFAQAYLDRLRASEAPEQQALDRLRGSNELLNPPTQLQGHQAAAPSTSESVGSLLADCMSAAIAWLGLPGSPQPAQTPQKSPSSPTGSSDAHTPAGQGNFGSPSTKSQPELPGQSPSESERLRANILMRDQD
jgi:hypothetical protein